MTPAVLLGVHGLIDDGGKLGDVGKLLISTGFADGTFQLFSERFTTVFLLRAWAES